MLADVVGRVDPDGRRPDHGPRRRRRACACRRASRPSRSWCCSSGTRTARREAAGRARDELSGAGVRVELDDRVDIVVRPPGRRLGAEGRAGAGRGRPARPGAGRRHARAADSGRQGHGPASPRRRRGSRSSSDIQGELLAEATRRLEGRTHPASRPRRGASRPAATGSPACRGPRSVPRARIGWRADGVTVRCLRREDGSLPVDDAEPGLLATVGRAY